MNHSLDNSLPGMPHHSDSRGSRAKHSPSLNRRLQTIAAFLLLGSSIACSTAAQPTVSEPGLTYDAHTRSAVPIPPSEARLQTVKASLWFKASHEGRILEGAIFDRNGDLLFCDVSGQQVLRVTAGKQLSAVVTLADMAPGGLALGDDGRLYIAALNLASQRGAVLSVKPDGSDLSYIVAPDKGYLPNDLVFDAAGGFYFTDFRGTAAAPDGGVHYVTADRRSILPVMPHLAMANGVALSPNGKTLWVTELGRNLLHRADLASETTVSPVGWTVPYHFIGPAPDSMRTDVDGNVYVALHGQGRVMAFNRQGLPIGQILMPGRDAGHNLATTSLAIRPGTRALYIVTHDGSGGQGSSVFASTSFGMGMPAIGASRQGPSQTSQ